MHTFTEKDESVTEEGTIVALHTHWGGEQAHTTSFVPKNGGGVSATDSPATYITKSPAHIQLFGLFCAVVLVF